MSVKIRLTRVGKKHEPFYRVVAVDSRKKRDGKFLANIGTYNALQSTLVTFNAELYKEWVAKGAIPTDSAKKLFKLSQKPAQTEKPKKAAPKKTETKKASEPQVEKTAPQNEPEAAPQEQAKQDA